MKAFLYKRIIPIILSITILVITFFAYSIPVYASDYMPHDIIEGVEYGIKTGDWEPFYRFLNETKDGLMYLYSQMGAFVTKDFQAWVNNNNALESLANTVPARKEGDNIVFTKELMAQLKALLDEYMKTEQTKEENGGFYVLPTTDFTKAPTDHFVSSQQYRTFRNIIAEKGCLPVGTYYYYKLRFFDPFSDPDHPMCLVFDPEYYNQFIENPEVNVNCRLFCLNCWQKHSYPRMEFENTDQIYTSISDAIWEQRFGYRNNATVNSKEGDSWNFTLYSTTGENIRVFISELAAKNYSAGKRKVYFTKNYYNYVPEDLTVSIDDLEKSVADLEKIIEELLKKINDKTSESEIEDLLRLILEQLRDQQGTGGGGGGGNVNVNVDMKETNNWLSKIYSKVSQIFDKINTTIEDAEQTAMDKIQESLDEIIEQLKQIKGWTIADTIVDAADAVADWLDFIKDLITDVDGGVTTISLVMEDAANLMKTKFPFCVPWDVYLLISFLAHEPVTPVFELPIRLERYGIDESITIDLSRFSGVSTLSRTLLTVIYCYGLLNLTMKIIPMQKEES